VTRFVLVSFENGERVASRIIKGSEAADAALQAARRALRPGWHVELTPVVCKGVQQ
jgi:hypothetical protein